MKYRKERKFVAFFKFVGWWAFSLGFHLDVKSPNVEIHLPFGFIRIGWKVNYHIEKAVEAIVVDENGNPIPQRAYGLT